MSSNSLTDVVAHSESTTTLTENVVPPNDNVDHHHSESYLEWKRKMGEKRKRQIDSNKMTTTSIENSTSDRNNNTTNHHHHHHHSDHMNDDETIFITPTLKKTKLIKEILNQETTRNDASGIITTTDTTGTSNHDSSKSLLKKSKELKESQPQLSDLEKLEQKENELLKEVMNQSFLHTMQQEQHDDVNTPIEYLNYGWTPPSFYESLSEMDRAYILDKFGIHVQGREIPPPILTFEHMKFPKCLLKLLDDKNMTTPTPIQMQGIPCLLSGRDVIGIAFTGSGKTLVFTLPIVMYCYLEEKRKKLREGEGPLGLILCPNRELAKQTFDLVEYFFKGIEKYDKSGIQLNVSLCIGGIREDRIFGSHGSTSSSQRYYNSSSSHSHSSSSSHSSGIHMVVATPGRLIQMLNDKKMHLSHCRYICMDEADRLIDLGFEEEIKQIFEFLPKSRRGGGSDNRCSGGDGTNGNNRQPSSSLQSTRTRTQVANSSHHIQKVFFSATMPEKIQSLARQTLSTPIIVNVGRAGAANLDVVQEVEFVLEEDKIPYLLEVLQKTPPPVLIFSQNKSEVDTICEYLLLKGVEAVSIHSSKDQFEREYAIDSFKQGKKDVLVATDIVSKGIDFPNVRHVINFDMPREIENYVHRIGRTGRNGKTGLATTFINRNQSEQILLDLKYLLIEAKQKVPPILNTIYDPYANSHTPSMGATTSRVECKYCQGLGHRITECQKYHRDKQLQIQKALNSAGGGSLGEQ
ncbi:hypothetical protein FDP41_002075 [Naegleria fowleri]|uniref:RNA helicase n=1 Tax=Naegleria fowleri TaxID=5763 RepID=A0A6A5C0D7_NAEFO|nr:uncharacterized protein FDP41_002075 [Naegleria fowleri]KAF0979005.1 hypothetical protein FDP41_002075 [Naegleria fowleri]CAG4714506.1 unnamed protein product [Naegleria fowleri]